MSVVGGFILTKKHKITCFEDGYRKCSKCLRWKRWLSVTAKAGFLGDPHWTEWDITAEGGCGKKTVLKLTGSMILSRTGSWIVLELCWIITSQGQKRQTWRKIQALFRHQNSWNQPWLHLPKLMMTEFILWANEMHILRENKYIPEKINTFALVCDIFQIKFLNLAFVKHLESSFTLITCWANYSQSW